MRNAFRIFRRDMKRLLRNPAAILVLIGVSILPSLYAWFNIAANIDPYANTSGIKVAEKQEDGTFQFSKRSTSETPEGKVVDKDAVEISEVQHDSGYGDFIRVDINGDYGDLGAHMYAVRWDYYGDGDTVLATYGTKFAADNWMHKSMGIQLGLTKSDRCQLPEGTDGYGRWDVTVYATGYQDFTFTVDNEPEQYVYGTMNLPYADYYYGELGNKTDTTDGKISYDADLAGNAGMRAEGTYDAVTSATGKKWNSMFADTTYSSEADENGGGKILGVSGVEVAIEQSLYDQLTADAKDSKTSGVLGSLFAGFTPNEDQTVVPAAYKQLFADGTLSATITAEPEVDLTNVTPTLKTDSKYGDYQLKMDGLDLGEGNLVYGVIVKTKTGNYGMLQLENIWKGGSELAWSAGFKTTEVHGNSLRSTPYAATSGDTIVEISYLTSKGEYSVHLADGLYLPKKHNGTVTAESVAVAAGSIPVTLADLPEDFSAAVSADTLTGAAYADGKMTFDAKSVLPGSYTITVSDESGVYAPFSTSVILTTDAMPAAYDAEKGAVIAAKGAAAGDHGGIGVVLIGAADVIALAALGAAGLARDGVGVTCQRRDGLGHALHAFPDKVKGLPLVLDDIHDLRLRLFEGLAGVGVEDGLDEVGAVAHAPVGQRAGVSRQLDGGDDGIALTDRGLNVQRSGVVGVVLCGQSAGSLIDLHAGAGTKAHLVGVGVVDVTGGAAAHIVEEDVAAPLDGRDDVDVAAVAVAGTLGAVIVIIGIDTVAVDSGRAIDDAGIQRRHRHRRQ